MAQLIHSEQTITCSKSTIKTGKGVNIFEVNNKDTRTTRRHSGVFIVNFEHLTPFSSVSIIDFEK